MDIQKLIDMMISTSFNSIKNIMMDMAMMRLKKKKTILIKIILN
jgi:hypothetical protein